MKYALICLALSLSTLTAFATPELTENARKTVFAEHLLRGAKEGDAAQKFHVATLYENGGSVLERDSQKAAYWYREAAKADGRRDADLIMVLRARAALKRLGEPIAKHHSKASQSKLKRYEGGNGWQLFLEDFASSQVEMFYEGDYTLAYKTNRARMAYVEAASELGMPRDALASEYGDHA